MGRYVSIITNSLPTGSYRNFARLLVQSLDWSTFGALAGMPYHSHNSVVSIDDMTALRVHRGGGTDARTCGMGGFSDVTLYHKGERETTSIIGECTHGLARFVTEDVRAALRTAHTCYFSLTFVTFFWVLFSLFMLVMGIFFLLVFNSILPPPPSSPPRHLSFYLNARRRTGRKQRAFCAT